MSGESYTHGHHPSVLRVHSRRTVADSAAYLEHLLVPGASVLDVGCGPGTITVDMAERVAPARVVGVDSSAEIVAAAAALAAERGVSNAEFLVADAYALPFGAGEFGIVHGHQVLQHLGRPVDALREMRRVRAADGVVAVREVDYAGTIRWPHSPGLELWADLIRRVHRANGGEPDAGRRLKGWAREAGFAEVVAGASVWCFTGDEDRAWWGGAWAERALHSQFAADAARHGMADAAMLQAISDAWREWADDPDGWFAMPHGEILARH